MADQVRIAELTARNAALRAAVDRYVLRAGPATASDVDRIASELVLTDDVIDDLESTYRNLQRRAAVLVEHKVAEPGVFEDPARP